MNTAKITQKHKARRHLNARLNLAFTFLFLSSHIAYSGIFTQETASNPGAPSGQAPRTLESTTATAPENLSDSATLPELTALALENSPQTQRAWAAARAAMARKGQGYSIFYPQVTLAANYTRQRNDPDGFPEANTTPYGGTLSASWLVFNFGGNFATAKAVREALYAANYEYDQSLQNLVLAVQTAYYNHQATQANLTAAQATLEDAQLTAKSASMREEAGLSDLQESLRAVARLRQAEFQKENALAQLEATRATLASTVGLRVTQLPPIKPQDPPKVDDTFTRSIDELIQRGIAQRPALQAAYANYEASRANKQAATTDLLPQVALQASSTRTWEDDSTDSPARNDRIALTVSWNIFDGFNNVYERIEAREQERTAYAQLRQAELDLLANIWTQHHALKSAIRQTQAAEAGLDAATKAYDARMKGYQNGLNSLLDALDAQDDLAQARSTLVTAKQNLALALTRLTHALGDLPLETTETE